MTKIEIEIYTFLDGYNQEKLEDLLKQTLKDFGVKGIITNFGTGNTVRI
ncbi:MAG: hypothetical protein ACTSVB_05515 [Candidatus Heimdallarchaeaceae archaeon]